MNPFEIPNSEKFLSYTQKFLPEIIEVLSKWVGIEHIARLHFHYSATNKLFRVGNYTVECKIVKVNFSNVEYEHCRTFVQLPGAETYAYLNEAPGRTTDRFIAPDRYLKEVCIFPRLN